jgi:hypothetical protein
VAVVTSLFFGENFYVQRRNDLNKQFLWKALRAILPLHGLILGCLFWFDRMLPGLMMKAIVFLPVILVGLGIETLFAQRIIEAFDPKQVIPPKISLVQPQRPTSEGRP